MKNFAVRRGDKRVGPKPVTPDKSCLRCGRVGSREFTRVAPGEGYGNDVHKCTSWHACAQRQHQNRTGKRLDRTWRERWARTK